MAPVRLLSGFLTVGFWTLCSRVLGFVRDILIAAYLGTGPVAEAFLVAFSLPNMFRRFFAEGAFNMAFVPMFSKKVEAGEGAHEFARDALTGLASVLLLFTLIAQLFMPGLVLLMASGFAGDERFDLAVAFGRIAFPYILFISIAALLSGVLNATGRFAAAAAAPVLLNVLFIGALWIGGAAGWDTGLTLAWTVPVAGVAQMALVWIAASRAGFRLIPTRPHMTPELRRLAIIAAPAALAGGVVQINLLVGRQVASFFEGAIGWLNYADRLYQLPLGVVGIAVGVVLLPDLSRRLRAGDEDGGGHALSRAGEFALSMTVPAAAALIAIPVTLISVLFERGQFTAEDSQFTAQALMVYGLGLPAFVLQKVLQPLYFAREDTKRPFYFACVSLVINAVVAIGLMGTLGFIAAAWGTTLAAWGMVVLLWIWSRNMGAAARFDTRFWTRVPRIFAASAIMGVALFGAAQVMAPLLAMDGVKYLALLALVILGCVIYFGGGHVIGAFRLGDFKSALRRGGRG